MKIYLHSLDVEDIIKIKTKLNKGEYSQVISVTRNALDMVISGVEYVRMMTDEEIRISMKNGVHIDLKYPYDKPCMIY